MNLTTADTSGSEVISLGNSVSIRLDSGGFLVGTYYNGTTFIHTNYAVTLAGTGWHYVAYSFDDVGNVAKLYLDGVAVASTTATDNIAYNVGVANTFIGKRHGLNGTTYYFNGLIDDARIYNRVLTPAEIASLAEDKTITPSSTVGITVNPVNDAPVFSSASNFTSITEDQTTNAGQLVSSLFSSTDVDSGAVNGIALYSQTPSNGTWQYSTDGGSTWNGVGAVSGSSALLLRSTDYLRFSCPMRITRTPLRLTSTSGIRPPVRSAPRSMCPRVVRQQHFLVQVALLRSRSLPSMMRRCLSAQATSRASRKIKRPTPVSWSRLCSPAPMSIPVRSTASRSTARHQATAPGSTRPMAAVPGMASAPSPVRQPCSCARPITCASCLMLPVTRTPLRSVFYVWDQTSGSTGTKVDVSTRGTTTAFSSTGGTSSITVTAVNDAPVFSSASNFTTITEDQTTNAGQLVSSLFSSTDVDTGAVNGASRSGSQTPSNVLWQYSTDGGSTWNGVGAVSGSSALLLRSTDYVRFVPDAHNADAASISFYIWDQTSGSTGTKVDVSTRGTTTAFSSTGGTSSITVTAVNDAPVLAGTNNLTAINEDNTTSAGTLVSALIAGQDTDVDTGAATGIAVTAVDNTNGVWQYTTNGGTLWTAFGSPSATTARLLTSNASTLIRFVPNADWNGTATITYRAWDQTSGTAGNSADTSSNGGTTAFSTGHRFAEHHGQSCQLDAPVFSSASNFTTITEDQTTNAGQLVSSLFSSTDVDTGAVNGIALYSQTPSNGTWQYSTDGGSTWNGVGAVSGSSALLLRSTDYLRFVPDAHNADAASRSVSTSGIQDFGFDRHQGRCLDTRYDNGIFQYGRHVLDHGHCRQRRSRVFQRQQLHEHHRRSDHQRRSVGLVSVLQH